MSTLMGGECGEEMVLPDLRCIITIVGGRVIVTEMEAEVVGRMILDGQQWGCRDYMGRQPIEHTFEDDIGGRGWWACLQRKKKG